MHIERTHQYEEITPKKLMKKYRFIVQNPQKILCHVWVKSFQSEFQEGFAKNNC